MEVSCSDFVTTSRYSRIETLLRYCSGMGRPRLHDARTASTLLDEAERIVEAEGLGALTVRRVATAAGTTTRAVYTAYGSKEALVIALGARGFDLLRERLEALPETADPAADLVEAGVAVFRRFATEHPTLFRISIQRALPDPSLFAGYLDAAREALIVLHRRVGRLETAGRLGDRSVHDAAAEFHSLCEGLAAMELRGMLRAGEEERLWRDALGALVRGFALLPT
jgi:AcrR family transcriptional regulator